MHELPAELLDDEAVLESYRAHMSEISGYPAQVSRNFLTEDEGYGILRVLWESREAAAAELGYDPGE
jgi:hypothetical protein